MVPIKCPMCGKEGIPVVTKGLSTGGWAFFIALLFLCLPLCWLPFVIEGCKEEKRKCAACGSKIA